MKNDDDDGKSKLRAFVLLFFSSSTFAALALCRLFLKSYYWSRGALCATGNGAAEHIKSRRRGRKERSHYSTLFVPKEEEEEEEEEGKKSSLDFQALFPVGD